MKIKSFISIVLWLTLANIVGKVLGFGKDLLISYYYGASALTDAIFLALSIPTILLGVFTAATDSAVIPQYNRLLSTKGRIYADRNFSNVINLISLCGFIVSLVILVMPDIFIDLFAPGFNGLQREYSEKFLRIFSFAGLFHIWYCYFCSYTFCYRNSVIRMILAFSTNLLIVIVLVIWHDPLMIGLTLAYFIGSLVSAALPLISAVHLKYHHVWLLNFSEVEFRKYWSIFIPIMAGALLVDLNLFVDRFLASSFENGSISALNYASRITAMFDSMIVVGIGVVILPLLSQQNIEGNQEKFIKISTLVFKLLFMILLPLVVISMYLSKEIIQLIYYRGKFDMDSVEVVSRLFFYYSPLILLIPLQSVVSRFFHSLENTKTPLRITFVAVVLNILLSVILSRIFGLNGIVVATSLALILNVALLLFQVYRQIGWDKTIMNTISLFKILCSIMLLVVVMFTINQFDILMLWKVISSLVCGMVVYLLSLFLFMKNDIKYILNIFR